MAVSQYSCPSCKAALKSAQPLAAGAKIKCPKCGTVFAVGAAAPPRPTAVKPQTPVAPSKAAPTTPPAATKPVVPPTATPKAESVAAPATGKPWAKLLALWGVLVAWLVNHLRQKRKGTAPLVIWGVSFVVSCVLVFVPLMMMSSVITKFFGDGELKLGKESSKGPLTKGSLTKGPREEKSAPDVSNKPADFTMEVSAWKAEWKKNEGEASKKYKGKVIELTGAVHDLHDDPYGDVGYLYLKIEGDPVGIRCMTTDKEPWLKTIPGCTVKVRGECPGFGDDLHSCVIIETSPSPIIKISAQELAKEFSTDAKSASEKYAEKWLLIEGEVTSKEKDKEASFLNLDLKGEDGIKITISVKEQTDFQKKRNASIEVGRRVKAVGNVSFDENKKAIEIRKGYSNGLISFPSES